MANASTRVFQFFWNDFYLKSDFNKKAKDGLTESTRRRTKPGAKELVNV